MIKSQLEWKNFGQVQLGLKRSKQSHGMERGQTASVNHSHALLRLACLGKQQQRTTSIYDPPAASGPPFADNSLAILATVHLRPTSLRHSVRRLFLLSLSLPVLV